jgi:hypothetical protein
MSICGICDFGWGCYFIFFSRFPLLFFDFWFSGWMLDIVGFCFRFCRLFISFLFLFVMMGIATTRQTAWKREGGRERDDRERRFSHRKLVRLLQSCLYV